MNALTLTSATLTMSSREIADLVESRHDNVRTTIERLVERGVIALPAMQEKATGGRPSIEYVFSGNQGKRDSLIVVAQLCPEFTARLVDRWQELEAKVGAGATALNPANLTRLQLIEIALQAEQERMALQTQNEEMRPKVEAFSRIAEAEGSVCVSTAAKLLQIRPKDAFAWLSAHRWIFKRHGGSPWLGYQDKIQQGLLEMKVDTVERSDGTTKTVESVLVTPKGLAKLAEQLQPLAA